MSRTAGEPEQVLYHPAPPDAESVIHLEGAEAKHAIKSLRLREGATLWITDGAGLRHRTVVTAAERRALRLEVLESVSVPRWPDPPVWVCAGVLRSTRMDFVLEKASELGAARFVPLVLDRSVAKPSESGAKMERWHRIAVESLKQSRRSHLMEVAEPVDLEGLLQSLPKPAQIMVADPEGADPRAVSAPGKRVRVLISGPEGGLSPRELDRLREHGAELMCLGNNRLRAETAVVALLVAGLAVGGDLTGESGPPS